MFKVITKRKGRKGSSPKFHTLDLALEACEVELRKGKSVELCDMETTRLMSTEALHPYVGAMRRVNHG